AAQALWTGAGERRARALIVLSDGEDHAGALDAALARLRAQGVQVFVLGVGTRVGAPVPARMVAGKPQGHVRDRRGQVVISRLGPAEQRTLRQLAGSKGHYVALSRARSGSAWVQARLAGLRQQAAQLARRNLQQDRYRWALIPALLWWLLESLWPLLCWLMACLRPKRSGMHA
ncbi:MAG: VWA domain-containing protein, partial [Polyangiales bacterium]